MKVIIKTCRISHCRAERRAQALRGSIRCVRAELEVCAPTLLTSYSEILLCVVMLPLVLLSACGKKDSKPPPMPPAEVSVVMAASEPVNHTTELPGRINPMREAQVRARATGILLKRLFEEGSDVK